MRPLPFPLALLLTHTPLPLLTNALDQYTPFLSPYQALSAFPPQSPNADIEINLELFRRKDGNCAKGKSCAYLGDDKACCDSKSFCAVDEGGHVACCPMNAHCTGAIAVGGGATPTAGSGLTAVSTDDSAGKARITGSADGTVQNPYFPYAYLPTNYPNAAICTSSFHDCQSQYASCTNSLAGDAAPGVTVSAGDAGGVTRVGGGGQMPLVQATSVCSSLSIEACHSLTLPSCKQFGGASGVGKGAKQSFSVDGDKESDAGVLKRGGNQFLVGIGIGASLALISWGTL